LTAPQGVKNGRNREKYLILLRKTLLLRRRSGEGEAAPARLAAAVFEGAGSGRGPRPAQATGATGRVRISIGADDLAATVVIADNGPGIPDEIRAKIFEPFFTTKHRGTGLGLPTARRVVERHHGTVEVECPPSGGTVVTVTLPAQ